MAYEVNRGEIWMYVDSAINLLQIHTVEKSMLRQYVGRLPADKMHKVCEAVTGRPFRATVTLR